MAPRSIASAAALVIALACNAGEPAAAGEAWVIGYWRVTIDEDQNTLGSVYEFTPSGEFILFDDDCDPINSAADDITYRIDGNTIIVTGKVLDEPPVSLVFHASNDRKRLEVAWPEMGESSTLERTPANRCIARK